MLRHLVRLNRGLTLLDGLAPTKSVRYGQPFTIARHFSKELTTDWPQAIKSFLEREKIDKPTLIQEKTLPFAMENKDLVGIARTGSGKTLAFVIPAVMKILKEREVNVGDQNDRKEKLPSCLILAPTRELATQTASVLSKFRNLGIKSIVLVGGSSRSNQVYDLSFRDHDVYIATPGRLLDLVETETVDLSNIKYLVLDEADRMLDMGFEPQIRRVVEKIPKDRQTLMWSATWPEEIQSLANEFMKNFEFVAVDSEKLKANPNIQQIVHVCESRDKFKLLIDHFNDCKDKGEDTRTLIFTNTKRMADQLLVQLMRHRHRAIALHGDRSQRQRDDALRLFRNRSCNIMVATDVAARGLDISDITHVINYDFPNTVEDYIHRIGRTARHDKKGVSITYFTPDNVNLANKFMKVLHETGQKVPPELEKMSRERHLYRDQGNPAPRRRRESNRWYDYGGR